MKLAMLFAILPLAAYADATFTPLDPAPSPAQLTPQSVVAGSSLNLGYSANYATSCAVSQVGCTGLVFAASDCTGSGPQGRCAATGAVVVPSTTPACTSTITVTCQPGNVTSATTLAVAAGGGPTPPPVVTCDGLARLPTGTAGQYWTRVLKASVKFGDGTVATGRDATDYLSMWTYPGNTPSWPGNSGVSTRPTGAAPNMYFSEKFVVSATGRPQWAWSGSGINSNFSVTISACPGDFGQTGTQITTGCRTDSNRSSGGLLAWVSQTQAGSICSLKPGGVYYLNLLPMAHLPDTLTGGAISTCNASPCSPWVGMTN